MKELVKRFEKMLKTGIEEYFNYDDYENLINYYKDKKDRKTALKACKYALDYHSYDIDFYYEYLYLLFDLGNNDDVIDFLEKALNIFPNDELLLVLQIRVYVYEKNSEKAKETLKQLNHQGGSEVGIHYLWGHIYFRLDKNYENAEKHFLQCINLTPKNSLVYSELANLYIASDDVKAGILYFDSLTEKNPTNSNLWYGLGLLYDYAMLFDDAKTALENALCLDENNHNIIYLLGEVCRDQKDYLMAIDYFKRVLNSEHDVNVRNANYEIGQCYEFLGSKKAMKYYKNSLKKDPLYLLSLYALGKLYYKYKEWFLAHKLFDICLTVDYENPKYWYAIACANKAMGNMNSTEGMFEKASRLDKENYKVWREWGKFYIESEQYNEGANILKDGVNACPTNSTLYYLLAYCLIKTGQYQEGLVYLENGLSLNYKNHKIILNYIDSEELRKTLTRIFEKYKNEL